MRERDVKAYFLKQAAARGALARKVRWEGRNGAPDWVLMQSRPWLSAYSATIWVELKASDGELSPGQIEEHKLMRSHGQHVEVVDSKESVDALFT